MTNSQPEQPEQPEASTDSTDGTAGIDDEQLPEDLQPSEDNPLAEPLSERDDAHSVDDLDMQGGKTPEGTDDEEDGGDTGTEGTEGTDGDGSTG